jgi:hypothetical protein
MWDVTCHVTSRHITDRVTESFMFNKDVKLAFRRAEKYK